MLPIMALATYFTSVNFIQLYIIGQSVDFLKLVVASSFLRKEKWIKNLTVNNSI